DRDAGRIDHCGKIDRDDARPIARVVGEQVFAADAGIVERDVRPSEVLPRAREGPGKVCSLCNVAAGEDGGAPLRGGQGDSLAPGILIDIRNDDPCATFEESEDRSPPDPRTAATHDSYLACNLHDLLLANARVTSLSP